MANSANGNVKITTEIETAGLQESLNRLESIFNSFATNLKEQARKTGEDVSKELSQTDKATKTLQDLGNTAKKVGSELKNVGVAALGLAGSFAGIVKGAISTADRVDELSKRLGISVQSFSRLDYVASQSGTSVEAFGTSMRVIAQNINTGSDAYKQLGVSIRDSNGALKTQDQILLETIKALQKMPAGTQKSAMALKALGRNSQQLNEILNMTSDEFENLMKRSDELGLTLDSKTTKAAQQISDKFTDLSKTFKMSLVQAVTPMIPAIEKLTDKFIKMLQPGGELANAFQDIAQAGLSVVENVLPGLLKGLAWVVKNGPAIIGVFTAIKTALQAFTGNWVGAIATALTGAFSATVLHKATKTKKKVDEVKESVKELSKETKNLQVTENVVIETTEDEADAFDKWTKKLDEAEKALKEFVRDKSTLEKGFDIKSLSTEDLIQLSKLKGDVSDAKATLKTLQDAISDTNEEIKKTDAFDKWTTELNKAEDDLKDFIALQASLTDGVFDVTLLSDEDLAKFDTLKAKVSQAKSALDSLTDAMKENKEETEDVVEKTEESRDAFQDWTDAVDEAENALKEFIKDRSSLKGGFNIESLSKEDLLQYDALKAKVAQARDAINSMNEALNDSEQELSETDAFERWTNAVDTAEKELKEFIATRAAETGSFDIERLTDDERDKFEKLRETVKIAKQELQSLQDATNTATTETSNDLLNVADTISQAWGSVGSAFGNGIESVVQTIVDGSSDLSSSMSALSNTMANTLSAVGDALIQAGIAKQVTESLSDFSIPGSYAIAMGLAIKAAAGTIKGLLAKISAGSFAGGGIVGGSSYSGDRMSANVNSGEMIINRQQQADLWNFIKNGSNGGFGSPNIEIINNAGVDIQTETNTDSRSLRILVNQQIGRFLGSPAGGRIMKNSYGTRQLGRR